MKRTLAELLQLLKTDPGKLTPAELRFVRGEIKRLQPGPAAEPAGGAYDKIKEEARGRRAAISRSGRDIGELPPVASPSRKAGALATFLVFCETYFSQKRFPLAWSKNHLEVIATLQRVIEVGGKYVLAVERGFGKTSLLEVAAIYGVVKGLHPFVQVVSNSRQAALEILDSIRYELEDNELLGADFPEVCYPIGCLDGIANRAAGQLYKGKRTKIAITKDEITLPTIEGVPSSGAIIRVTGILGRIRGRKKRLVRPTLVLIDDAQTDTTALSPAQNTKREDIISGAVLGLAGPTTDLAVLMAGTVIEIDDLTARFLSASKHLQWIKTRFKLLGQFPANMKLWDQYATIQADELRNGGDGALATAFYRDRRDMMDAGAEVSWPQRYGKSELSALQRAMNLYFENRKKFFSEYQNEPQGEDEEAEQLDAELIAGRVNGQLRRVVPLWATKLTGFIDVQKSVLFWMVCAWGDDFSGAVIDYGVFPAQGRDWFRLDDCRHTLQELTPGGDLQATLLAGLKGCEKMLLERVWIREDLAPMSIERLLADASWGDSTDTVYAWARQSPHGAIVLPSHGRFIGATSKPWHLYKQIEGEKLGTHWILAGSGKRAMRHLSIDANYWKTFIRDRLRTAVGGKGALTLFGRESRIREHRKAGESAIQPPANHGLLAAHWTAEYFLPVTAQGRTVTEWKWRPGRPDNHWLDCVVGCAAAASERGVVLKSGGQTAAHRPVQEISFAEAQRQAWDGEKRRRA